MSDRQEIDSAMRMGDDLRSFINRRKMYYYTQSALRIFHELPNNPAW